VSARAETLRITASMTVVCALGAAILGGVYVATDRYQRAAQLRSERDAIAELLGLDSAATVTEVRQFLMPARGIVVYETRAFGEEGPPAKRLAFSLDGQVVAAGAAEGAGATAGEKPQPLGRLFLARRGAEPAGFVVEGNARGYKNRIRFLVGLDRAFEIAGVRVVEHEEDPGLGAEVATRAFGGQFIGRTAADMTSLTVTRDPMPEDWRAALAQLSRVPATQWREREGPLLARERAKPIYAVTGATISSRALTDGLRTTVDHFRRRWALLEPLLGGGS
jgi:electron transport complex protein RnfG